MPDQSTQLTATTEPKIITPPQGSNVKTPPEHERHMDVSVSTKQSMSAPVVLQAVVLFGCLAANYATMVANDREHAARLDQMRTDITRVERDTKDLKVEILGELREIRAELRDRTKASR